MVELMESPAPAIPLSTDPQSISIGDRSSEQMSNEQW